jgi:hypothetical protein
MDQTNNPNNLEYFLAALDKSEQNYLQRSAPNTTRPTTRMFGSSSGALLPSTSRYFHKRPKQNLLQRTGSINAGTPAIYKGMAQTLQEDYPHKLNREKKKHTIKRHDGAIFQMASTTTQITTT